MRKTKQRIIFSIFILSICYAKDSPCGDWEPYKDEKCFKIFDKVGSIVNAEKTCSQEENTATLIIIRSKDEQDFLSNLLFNTHKIVDNVWIGVKYTSNKFKWIDDSDLSFTNWAEGSPSNKTEHDCVQIEPDGSSMGKWIDVSCNKNNKFACQKMQNWSISHLQKTLLNARKELQDSLEDVRKQLNNHESTISKQQTTINNLKQNTIPIGFIYVQLPQEKSPTEIWPLFTWNDVSSTYPGVFFRVTGGEAALFGQVQQTNSPHLIAVNSKLYKSDSDCIRAVDNMAVIPKEGWSDGVWTGGSSNQDICTKFQMSAGEVRPLNMAIRVWKRTG